MRSNLVVVRIWIGQSLKCVVSSGLKSSFCCAVSSMGQWLMNDFAVWYFTSHAVNPPWVRIFQSSMSSVEGLASLMNIVSVKRSIMALLKSRCFMLVAVLL